MTYAWFTTNSFSAENIIESSHFALDISVTDYEGNSVSVTENSDGTFSCALGEGRYTVLLEMTDDTTATKGYCNILLNGETKHTVPISSDPSVGNDTLSFVIDLIGGDADVVFEARWGMSASADIADGDTVTVSIPSGISTDGVADEESAEEEESAEGEESTESEEAPESSEPNSQQDQISE